MKSTLRFADMSLPPDIKSSLQKMGLETLTDVQKAAILPALSGRDVLASSQTGTGKTAAYAVPVLAWLYANPGRQALILVPTRELAAQIHKVMRKIGKSSSLQGTLVIGGESFARQKIESGNNVDYLVATPGRLNDHLQSGSFDLSRIAMLVLDEVDLMMDMGFAPQVKEITRQLPAKRQTLFFSATLPAAGRELAEMLLRNPARVSVGATTEPVATVSFVNRKMMSDQKTEFLLREVAQHEGRILVFARTKIVTEQLFKVLHRAGHAVDFLHGERTQKQRREALEAFKDGRCRILIATDLAARGLDIVGIECLINYHLPQSREDYIHRVGRAGRHGKKGVAVNFVTPRDKNSLRKIGKMIGLAEPPAPRPPAPRKPARRFTRK